MGEEVIGIDVSHWQGAVLWDKVAKQAHFAYIKATESKSWQDPRFQENWQESKDAGVVRGAYHFFRAHRDAKSPRTQAENFFNVLSKTGDLGELTPILDVEQNTDGLTKSELQNALWKFINRFEGLIGGRVAIYTSKGFWDGNVASYPGNTDIPRHRMLWVANYRQDPPPAIPFDWEKRYGPDCWSLWQVTSKGEIDGVATHVDLNRYNGDLDAFNKEFKVDVKPIGEPAPEPPPPPDDKPKIVKIVGLNPEETLRMRDEIWGSVQGKTWNGAVFGVMAQKLDGQGRQWYKLGPSIWIASWYTEVVE